MLCTTLHCTAPRTVLYCSVRDCAVLDCAVLFRAALHCTVQFFVALYGVPLRRRLRGFLAKRPSTMRGSRKYATPRAVPQSCWMLPPVMSPGLYLSFVPGNKNRMEEIDFLSLLLFLFGSGSGGTKVLWVLRCTVLVSLTSTAHPLETFSQQRQEGDLARRQPHWKLSEWCAVLYLSH